jgi:hypothetical protein
MTGAARVWRGRGEAGSRLSSVHAGRRDEPAAPRGERVLRHAGLARDYPLHLLTRAVSAPSVWLQSIARRAPSSSEVR